MDLTALLTLADFEAAARATLDEATWAYLAGGAGSERSVAANLAAFERVWFQPGVLGGGRPDPSTAVTLFGRRLDLPVLLAPTSPQRLFHDAAELAAARAAAAEGTVGIVSADGHYPFPEVAAAAPGRCWFQLYPYRSVRDLDAMVAMAQDAGATGLVVTVDAFHRPRRLSVQRARFRVPDGVDFGTLRLLGILDAQVPADARIDRIPLGWADLERLRRRTTLPLLVKGILSPDDAAHCADAGLDGIVVSNHGGRQLDGVLPSLVALERVRDRVGDGLVLLADGGIRSGADVVKALALGADAVCVGRPQLWGLRLAGQDGVRAVLALLRREIEDVLLQLGLPSVAAVRRDCVLRTP